MKLLADKVALVTGAARGIGQAGAEVFAGYGAKVVAADINEIGGQAVVDGIIEKGGEATFERLDVRDSNSVQAVVNAAVARHGRIDALFHNAMSAPFINNEDRRITELPDDTWDEIIRLVLTGSFLTTKYVARQMLAQGSGSIVLTATVDAVIGQAGIDGYTAAKGGLISLTRSAAAGLSPEGVRINALCPSFVTTPAQAGFLEDPEQRAQFEAHHLMPITPPEDIAEYAAFLASDKARRVTGAVHLADAGYSCFKGKMDLRGLVST